MDITGTPKSVGVRSLVVEDGDSFDVVDFYMSQDKQSRIQFFVPFGSGKRIKKLFQEILQDPDYTY